MNKNGNELLGISNTVLTPNTWYHMVIEMNSEGLVYQVKQGDNVVVQFNDDDIEYREGWFSFQCCEATCTFDNLSIKLQ